MASNGLSIYRKGKEEGKVSGGNIGDVVVREIGGGHTPVMIITESEWEAMPKDEKAANEIIEASVSEENLKAELAKAKNKIAELEAEIANIKKEKKEGGKGAKDIKNEAKENESQKNEAAETSLLDNNEGEK